MDKCCGTCKRFSFSKHGSTCMFMPNDPLPKFMNDLLMESDFYVNAEDGTDCPTHTPKD